MKEQKLGILSFETAKTMSRLLSLYKSLSDDEISRLRNVTIKSEGVASLNSKDEGFHLSLACAERLGDLDRVASSISRLAKKCSDPCLNRFEAAYSDFKLFGIIDTRINSEYGSRVIRKKVRKMEKFVATTSRLYAALETLTEVEASKGNLKQCRSSKREARFDDITNPGLFYQRLEDQREKVRSLREASLWTKTFDKSVYLMARIVCVVYARICVVFRQYIVSENLVQSLQQREISLIQSIRKLLLLPHYSGSLSSTKSKSYTAHRFCSPRSVLFSNDEDVEDHCDRNKRAFFYTNGVFNAAEPSTLGGSGLALRYANVVLLAEKYLDSSAYIDRYERESLYQMLPKSLKALVKTKLSKNMKCAAEDNDNDGSLLAKGWRDAVMEIMGWLCPMAHNTVKWHVERNYEKVKFDSKPSVLLLQTLHFADREKTEAAIAEVLVGLSCIYRFENRRLGR